MAIYGQEAYSIFELDMHSSPEKIFVQVLYVVHLLQDYGFRFIGVH